MSAITLSARPAHSGHLRPINILRDLPAVADLLELCFHSQIDQEGRRTIAQVRSGEFMHWMPRLSEVTNTPRTGFVWEQDGRIVGNASLIPFRHRGRLIYLIANVATHPDYRRQGIGRALTERAMQEARERKADELWLHVRDDNPGAIRLYANLGFVERDRRTTWLSASQDNPPCPPGNYSIVKRRAHTWPEQEAWLRHLYPDEEAWFRRFDWSLFSPALRFRLYRWMMDIPIRHWAVEVKRQLQAVVSWMPGRIYSDSDSLWLALSPQADMQALTFLLINVRQELSHRHTLTVDLPDGLAQTPLWAAGFQPQRTLLWMSAPGATKQP